MRFIFEDLEPFVCTFEIKNGQRIQKQTIQAPKIMLMNQFMSYVQQATRSNDPIRIKMSRTIQIYDNFNQKWIERENSVQFINKAYENKNGGFNG